MAESSRKDWRAKLMRVPSVVITFCADSKSKPNCDVCSTIVKVLQMLPPKEGGSSSYGHTALGNFEEVMSSTRCTRHPWIFRSFFDGDLDTAGVTEFIVSRGANHINLAADISPDGPYGSSLHFFDLMLLPTASDAFRKRKSDPSLYARLVDNQWIDKNLFYRWKRCCNSQNYEACQQYPASSQLVKASPTWIIDTWRLCLVNGNTGSPYVALSYVWGTAPFFKTTIRNVARLQSDFALADSHQKLGVPRTIEDAIALVGLLKERYLWVDALCIVQDDDETKYAEINNMASIFAGASITIIAEQGEDANHGLRGLCHISQRRTLSQDIFRPAKGYNIVYPHKWPRQPYKVPLCSFYEEIEEDPGSKLRLDNRPAPNVVVFLTSFPCLYEYSELLRDYNRRNFTHPQDALFAASGITTALSRTFYGGFICGLPLMFLDVALCWQPTGKCERRVASTSGDPTELGLPSWSWVGWKCEPDHRAWENGCDYVKRSPSLRAGWSTLQTLPIVRWFSQNWTTRETTPIYQFQDTVQERKAIAMQGRDETPSGWTRYDSIVHSDRDSTEDGPAWNNLIPPRKQIGSYEDAVSIRDNQGNWVGALRLQTPLSYKGYNDSCSSQEKVACELVVISAGYAIVSDLGGDGIDEWYTEERVKGSRDDKYEFYNVLWVEWKNDIAYRKAMRRVLKLAWEAQDLEWIDLVLG
ncbi:uncharacterized protein PAC_11647 [Phialocephala subalpina]|uniref:Heterokaryon incompatibility domain-containing protein n=1 Tax=Phialocephala subalpina TaxID=576137 RepID=A0A1L7X9Q0_9HELO|nr:uncharacterized protein PAC_11647 [Phialocephala subalpina]